MNIKTNKSILSTFNLELSACPQGGFTLVETLVAIFILMLTIGALLTLTAGGFFSIRYAKNDIVATNLLQESLEYIRNTRDTASEQTNAQWSTWYQPYSDACETSKYGCIINPYATGSESTIEPCTAKNCTDKPLNYYSDVGLYGYYPDDFDSDGKHSIKTSFVRSITMNTTVGPNPELTVTATISWYNGTSPKTVQQSMILTKWNLQ